MTDHTTAAQAAKQDVSAYLSNDEIRWASAEARKMTAPSDTTSAMDYVRAGAAALLSKLRAPVADERDRNATISEVVGLCNRIPGATTWNAAEFMYDELQRRAALSSAPIAGERTAFDVVAGLVPPCASRRGNDFREGYLEARVDALRLLRTLASAPVANPQGMSGVVCGYTPGMSQVEIQLPRGTIFSGWLELGSRIHLSAEPAASAPVAHAATKQDALSRFDFLEGLVDQQTLEQIADTALVLCASAPVAIRLPPRESESCGSSSAIAYAMAYNKALDDVAALNASAPVAGMKPLDPEFAKVLSDNFDSLMVRMPSESAPVAGEAQPSDEEIMAIVREQCSGFDDAHEGPDQDDMIRTARALLSRYAAPQASEAPIIEEIARQWDGCAYDAPGGPIDIGEAIRTTAKRNSVAQASEAYTYARNLAVTIWEKRFKQDAPDWKPCDDLIGVLTQIDNMTAGLVVPRGNEAARDPEDAERWRWVTAIDENAQTLHSIVLCHGGDQQKINERADFYRAALSAQPGAQKESNDEA